MMGGRRGGGGEKSSISLQDGGKEGEKRNDWGGGLYTLNWSSQHLAGDAFQFDSQQLNPSPVGPERRGMESKQKRRRRSNNLGLR